MTEDVAIVQIRPSAPEEWDAACVSGPTATYFHSREGAAVWGEWRRSMGFGEEGRLRPRKVV
jgi:hypothetical protein